MFEMSKIGVPIITVVIGEGSSGGALAISVGNKIFMLENAIYSILSPEGYASILWKDSTKAKEVAEKMKLTAKDLYDFKIVDKIIKEDGEFEKIALNLKKEILKEIKNLKALSKEDLIEQRYQKFRKIGEFKKYE